MESGRFSPKAGERVKIEHEFFSACRGDPLVIEIVFEMTWEPKALLLISIRSGLSKGEITWSTLSKFSIGERGGRVPKFVTESLGGIRAFSAFRGGRPLVVWALLGALSAPSGHRSKGEHFLTELGSEAALALFLTPLLI